MPVLIKGKMESFFLSIYFLFIISGLVSSSPLNSDRPHIILIVADDLGYNDVSFHGSEQIPTPNLDFLAYSGIILNNYYISPICTPTRSALLTGRHPIHTGMQHGVIIGDQPYGLPLNETLMSEHLNKLGYKSHIVGKWHLGMFQWDYTPLYRGFESHFGYYQGSEDYYLHTYQGNYWTYGLDFRRNKDLLWNYTGKYSTSVFQDEAVNIIENHDKSQSLFLYLPFQAVHSGNLIGPHLQAPKKYVERFSYIRNKQRRLYAAMLSALDDAVGEIYDTLKQTGILSNSVIIFTTDNGGPANGFNQNAASNFPLRGVKETLWEGGVRGVGFVHSPLLRKQGYVSNQLFHVCDWLPTIYKAAGGDPSSLKNLDGFDAWKMLNENGDPIRSEVLHNIDPIHKSAAIRVGDYKLLVGHVGASWDGWYPPYQLDGDEVALHVSMYNESFQESKERAKQRRLLEFTYKNFWESRVHDRVTELQKQLPVLYSHNQRLTLQDEIIESTLDLEKSMNLEYKGGKALFITEPVKVECGPKPSNASTSCKPGKAACLFNIKNDPCEYKNIAEDYPKIVSQMLARLNDYQASAVKPRNQPDDSAGDPALHGGAWIPWR